MATGAGYERTAMLGFALLATLLVAGMAFSIHRFAGEADAQVVELRGEEAEISRVQRLRWLAQLLVSSGRGYLLSGDPALLAQARSTRQQLGASLEVLRASARGRDGRILADDAERAALEFIRVQGQLLDARQRGDDPRALARRFESELLPLSRALDRSLTRLVERKEAGLGEHYEEARHGRTQLAARLYGLLATLLVLAMGIGGYLAKRLGRSLETERAALESARKAVAARDELMGVVAHDLRNPLGAITTKAALVKKTSESERTRQQAESIENVAMRMEYLIQTMLDVTTLEAGRFTVDVARCALADLLRETADLFGALAASKQVRFDQRAKEPDLVLLVDRERVLQVLSNLIGNAIKFTPPGGHVTLLVERQGAMAQFGVLDTGPGIAANDLPRIFERFWTETPGKKGTGLGLYIAKGIVDAHGGRIWAASEVDRGARFFFTVPIATAAEEELPSAQAHPTPHPV